MSIGIIRFYDTTYTIWRSPAPDANGKIGEPIIWKFGVKMTQFWPMVALMRIAKAPQTPFTVKVAYTNEMGILDGDIITKADGQKWHVEGVDPWGENVLEVYAWEIK